MSDSNKIVEIDFDRVVSEYHNVWIVDVGDRQVMLPKSECDIDEDYNMALVPMWLAIKEGLV